MDAYEIVAILHNNRLLKVENYWFSLWDNAGNSLCLGFHWHHWKEA